MDVLATQIKTTAVYSPLSIGIVKIHNAVLENSMTKVNLDKKMSKMDKNEMLNYLLMEKNSLMNRLGFLLSQIVFGDDMWSSTVEKNYMASSEIADEMVRQLSVTINEHEMS